MWGWLLIEDGRNNRRRVAIGFKRGHNVVGVTCSSFMTARKVGCPEQEGRCRTDLGFYIMMRLCLDMFISKFNLWSVMDWKGLVMEQIRSFTQVLEICCFGKILTRRMSCWQG